MRFYEEVESRRKEILPLSLLNTLTKLSLIVYEICVLLRL